MSKKITAAMKRALNDIIENVTVTNDEDYQHKHGYLDEYIRQGITLFTDRWYDDFLETDCEVSYTATEVIYDLHLELCIPLAEFLQAPSESLFRAMMAKAYFLTMGYVRHHLTGKPRDTGVSVRDSQFAFLASLFFSRDAEQVKQIFNDLADYHIQQSRTDKNRYPEFEYPLEQWMPWEILALLRLRTQKGLDNSMISHPLITPFLPFVGLELGGFFDDAQKNLRRAVFKEFGYQPVVDL